MAAKKKSPKHARTVEKIDTQTQLINMLHQVWLAGLGAVSRAQRGAPKLMEELVAEGAEVYADNKQAAEKALRGVQESLNSRMSKVRDDATDAFENLEKIFRARVHSALTQLGVPSASEVESLSRRVDTLNANIDKLTRTRKAIPRTRKGTPRVRTARKNGSSHTSAH
jgi:poly(hydroxyalkanoate) granule-associated protein